MTINDILNAISNGMLDMFTVFFQVLTNSILSPIDLILTQFDISLQTAPLITNFYNVLNTYFVPSISWFINLLPPTTWSAIKLHIDFSILIYSAVFTIHIIMKPLKFIKKLPLA